MRMIRASWATTHLVPDHTSPPQPVSQRWNQLAHPGQDGVGLVGVGLSGPLTGLDRATEDEVAGAGEEVGGPALVEPPVRDPNLFQHEHLAAHRFHRLVCGQRARP